MNEKAIFTKVLEKVKPTQSVLPKVKPILDEIQKITTKLNINATVQCGGSTAKDTYLATSHDCDVFIKFNYADYKNKDLSELLEKILNSTKYKFTKVHGSRDYFQATINNIEYEIIPVLNIKDPKNAKNVTDTSPLHVNWVVERTKDSDLTDQVRLTKQFAKAQKVYGAESYIGGFSGHIIDILVIYYGGFTQLLKASQKWKQGDIVDPMNFYKGKNALEFLNDSKIDSPLIIIDPILSERNAASALTEKRWTMFKKAAKKFLNHPDIDFFTEKPLDKSLFPKNVTEITLIPQTGKSDVVGAKCKKVFEYILTKAKEHDFDISQADWEFTEKKASLFYVTIVTELEETKIIKGPPLKMKKACAEFSKNKNTFEKDDFIYAEEKRKYPNFTDLLKDTLKSDYVKERVKSAKMSN